MRRAISCRSVSETFFKRLLSFVIPLYNEEEVLPQLREALDALAAQLSAPVEWIMVNDGSRDLTSRMLFEWASRDPRVKVIDLARNFGHQAAVTAGLDYANGDAVIVMDADLQDPPELAVEMLARYREGYDVAYAQRIKRAGETRFKLASAALFYKIMRRLTNNNLPENTGDFRLMSREAARALGSLREGHRFLRGMSVWIGFKQVAIPFERQARAAGETKYPLHKMVKFAWDAVLSFSSLPLRLASFLGLMVFLFGFGYGVYAFLRALIFHDLVPGWATIIVLQSIIGGTILLCFGMMGEYIGRIYEEIKQRPLYIVRRSANISEPARAPRAVSAEPERSPTGLRSETRNDYRI